MIDPRILREHVRGRLFSLENPFLAGEVALFRRGLPVFVKEIEIFTTSCPTMWWRGSRGEERLGNCIFETYRIDTGIHVGMPTTYYCAPEVIYFYHRSLLAEDSISHAVPFTNRIPVLVPYVPDGFNILFLLNKISREKDNPFLLYSLGLLLANSEGWEDEVSEWARRCQLRLNIEIDDCAWRVAKKMLEYHVKNPNDVLAKIGRLKIIIEKARVRKPLLVALDRDGTTVTGHPPGPIRPEEVSGFIRKGNLVYAYGNMLLTYEFNIPYAYGERKDVRLHMLADRYRDYRKIVIDNDTISVPGWEYKDPISGKRLLLTEG